MEGDKGVVMKENKEHPTNLLERFSPDKENPKQSQQSNSESLHEPDLNLQLSLGINFEGENSLTRSSSMTGFMTQRKDSREGERRVFSLERSCSLPAEREQQQRLINMRELQAMRRIQAKNRLLERQRISRENKEKEKSKASLQEPMLPLPPAEMATWAAASPAKSPPLYQAIVNVNPQGELAAQSQKGPEGSAAPKQPKLHKYHRGLEGSAASKQPKLHKYHTGLEGSAAHNQPKLHKYHIGTEGSAAPNQPSRFHLSSDPRNIEPNQPSKFHLSSDPRNIEPNQPRRFHPPSDPTNIEPNQPSRFCPPLDPKNIEPNQPSRFRPPSDPRNIEPVISPGATSNRMLVRPAETKPESPCKRPRITGANFEDNGIDVMRQMPSVTTTGDGPNGKRIEGFLYTYTKGHVSIVCVCHGSFLSPAEFVKHAGGKDVPNPMKHITVYSALSG
ncbi:uncharacterized protein LOC116105958 isoform X2 [Pistacia vera]|uniref:uncharacterized protein LOC116105958 isoform X2 n=1 Tax=Pistacia vera TaxID=55513 RepID=UPI001263D6D5|nr:uncharacterized protein LOC116105958 isoform X2 [Pistacia vera]